MIPVVYLGDGFFHPVAVFFFSKSVFGRGLNPFTTGNPFLGTKLLGFSVERGSGALKGLSSQIEKPPEKKWCIPIVACVLNMLGI